MKSILSIMLLLITSCYILPVKQAFLQDEISCTSDMEKKNDNDEGKDKSKEIYHFSSQVMFIQFNSNNIAADISYHIPSLLHTVETPPPNFI